MSLICLGGIDAGGKVMFDGDALPAVGSGFVTGFELRSVSNPVLA